MSENNAASEPPKLYTMDEAAELLRVSLVYLYRMRQRGQLTVVKFGRRTLGRGRRDRPDDRSEPGCTARRQRARQQDRQRVNPVASLVLRAHHCTRCCVRQPRRRGPSAVVAIHRQRHQHRSEILRIILPVHVFGSNSVGTDMPISAADNPAWT
ncbi:helix-turn-helix domain-containing protein [Mycolicibacterium goodii]|nr:helix-turn-helix domain-containing protein [Mycolicibacterium goodii]